MILANEHKNAICHKLNILEMLVSHRLLKPPKLSIYNLEATPPISLQQNLSTQTLLHKYEKQ